MYKIAVSLIVAGFVAGLTGVYAATSFAADSADVFALELKKELEKSAELCYALNGFYPPNLDFLLKYYNFSSDKNKYAFVYEYDEDLPPKIEVRPR